MIKKADIILFIILCLLGGGISALTLASFSAGTAVEIYVDGKLHGTYPLSLAGEVTVSSPAAASGETAPSNTVTIADSMVTMTHSTCKNQVCVHTGSIRRSGSVIACLPNRVLVKVIGSGKGGDDNVDIVTG